MIDFETLFFMKQLDELALLSSNGIRPFSEATEENRHDFVFYDEQNPGADNKFPIVLDALVDELHHDIISYLNDGNYDADYKIGVLFDDDKKPYIELKSGNQSASLNEWLIAIEDGRWYFA